MKKIYILPDGEEIDISTIRNIGDLISEKKRTFMSLGYWYFIIYSSFAVIKTPC